MPPHTLTLGLLETSSVDPKFQIRTVFDGEIDARSDDSQNLLALSSKLTLLLQLGRGLPTGCALPRRHRQLHTGLEPHLHAPIL